MAFSPVPDRLLILPSSSLTLPASTARQQDQSSRPQLRILFTPHLMVPTDLVSTRVYGRKVEECLDVVVPVGGRVTLDIDVKDESLELLECHGTGTGSRQDKIPDELMRRVTAILKSNRQTLGLPINGVHSPSLLPAPVSDLSTHIPPVHPSNTLTLLPKIAEPIHSPLSNNLVPIGKPIAYLSNINISFQWRYTTVKLQVQEQEKEDSETGNSQQSNSSSGTGSTDDYDIIVDDDEEGNVILEDDGEEPVSYESSQSSTSATRQDCWIDFEPEMSDAVLPKWAQHQLHLGLHKIIRLHLIRRFPLIFDGDLIAYTSSFALPPSLSSSISHMLTTSRRYKTQLAFRATPLLKDIVDSQEQHIGHNIQSAIELPARKARKKARQETTEPEALGGPRQKRNGKNKIQEEDPDPAAEYITKLRARLQDADSAEVARVQEKKLRRVLGDASGRIGRAIWSDGRQGLGRLAAWKIKLRLKEDACANGEGSPIAQESLCHSVMPLRPESSDSVIDDESILDEDDFDMDMDQRFRDDSGNSEDMILEDDDMILNPVDHNFDHINMIVTSFPRYDHDHEDMDVLHSDYGGEHKMYSAWSPSASMSPLQQGVMGVHIDDDDNMLLDSEDEAQIWLQPVGQLHNSDSYRYYDDSSMPSVQMSNDNNDMILQDDHEDFFTNWLPQLVDSPPLAEQTVWFDRPATPSLSSGSQSTTSSQAQLADLSSQDFDSQSSTRGIPTSWNEKQSSVILRNEEERALLMRYSDV